MALETCARAARSGPAKSGGSSLTLPYLTSHHIIYLVRKKRSTPSTSPSPGPRRGEDQDPSLGHNHTKARRARASRAHLHGPSFPSLPFRPHLLSLSLARMRAYEPKGIHVSHCAQMAEHCPPRPHRQLRALDERIPPWDIVIPRPAVLLGAHHPGHPA